MDSKTRVLMALNHEKPDRPPFNFWMDRRLMADYEKRIGHRHWRITHYDADVIESFWNLPFPSGKFTEHEGTQWLSEPYPMSWDDVDSIPMPDPNADDVFTLIDQDIAEFPDRAVVMNMPTPWAVISNMRGYEQIYMDIMDHPEQYDRLARRIADVMKKTVELGCRRGITALYIQEDVSSAKGPMMSMEDIERFSFQYAQECTELAQSLGKPVLFHCCGSIMPLMDRFVQMGVNAVNPLQPHLNDLKAFHDGYGEKLCLYGGLDNTYVLSDGTVEQVRSHVQEVFETVGKDNGALIFSTHDLDIKTPRENIETMVKTIKGCSF